MAKKPYDWFSTWLVTDSSALGRHTLAVLEEQPGARAKILSELTKTVSDHYVSPDVRAKRLASLGAPNTAELLKEHLPTSKKAQSGDFGEILATETAERYLRFAVPIRRLQFKDGREMALRGDDIIGVADVDTKDVRILKGESKSRIKLATSVIEEAASALESNRGRPNRHSVLFVAARLRDRGDDDLATILEEAVVHGFKNVKVEHLLFVFCGNAAKPLLDAHLSSCKHMTRRHVVAVQVKDHTQFISAVFEALSG